MHTTSVDDRSRDYEWPENVAPPAPLRRWRSRRWRGVCPQKLGGMGEGGNAVHTERDGSGLSVDVGTPPCLRSDRAAYAPRSDTRSVPTPMHTHHPQCSACISPLPLVPLLALYLLTGCKFSSEH